ncbi:MAG: TylF/MycF/NovP-related O-methyltransferase [Thermoanaerobaculia bacterium]
MTPPVETPLERALLDWIESEQHARAAQADLLLSSLQRSPSSRRRHVFFLKWMYETFHAVTECFPPPEAGRAGQIDALAGATSPQELLYIAHHLYLLDQAGVPGVVLECGCFKGFSSCCLSHACAALGRRLVVADSFQGLPDPEGEGQGYYRRGDFCGTVAEVNENLRAFGRPEAVQLLPGWFRDSLRGWTEPIALLWLDVDLASSARDALGHAVPLLQPGGAVFSHEFQADSVAAGRIVATSGPAGALREHLEERGTPYRARFVAGWLGMVGSAGSVAPWSPDLVEALLPHLRDADHRVRATQRQFGPWKRRLLELGRH